MKIFYKWKTLPKRNWQSKIVGEAVRFSIQSPNGEGGYPGDVTAEISYTVDPVVSQINLSYRAYTTKPTPIDLTNHCYFNLNGKYARQAVYNHEVKLNAMTYLDVSLSNLIVTGQKFPVKGSKYDFTDYVKLSDRIEDNVEWPAGGYDNFFLVDQQCGKKYVARYEMMTNVICQIKLDYCSVSSVRNPSNGIRFDLFSDQNGVQFYTGNFLNQLLPSNGEKYLRHSGFCLETHNLPDAVNKVRIPLISNHTAFWCLSRTFD
jgi:aldose 1-epimerase